MATPLLSPSLNFKVWRCQSEFVKPALPTPHEMKPLSDIDDQEGLRIQIPIIQIYRNNNNDTSTKGKDPVEVLRDALAKTLVFYYPFAGRIREVQGRKLMVDCTAEGVLFIEADADVTLHQFGDTFLRPPFPCFQELLYDVPGTNGVINSPLLLIQVTRLKCGGFILVIRFNHTMVDGFGMVQFMNAWAEMAKGAHQPSILPVWRRELLSARNPPLITCIHREYEQVTCTKKHNMVSFEGDDMLQRSFFFGPTEIAILRRLVPHHLSDCTRFELITACIWYCRTKAMQFEPEEEVIMMCIVNARSKFNPPLPVGYYGNCFAFPAAVTTAGKLLTNPFGYAVELIKKVIKDKVTEEYMHSVADLMVIKRRPLFTTVRSYIVSNVTRVGARDVDFGWGKAVYGGAAKAGAGDFPNVSFFTSYENTKGEDGLLFPINLPATVMKRFEEELGILLGKQNQLTINGQYPTYLKSFM